MDKRKQDIAYFISFCIEQLTCTIQIKMPHLQLRRIQWAAPQQSIPSHK